MFEHILAPLDGSALAEIILPHLVALAHINASRVTLLRVLDADGTGAGIQPVDPFEWQLRKAEAETYLQNVAQRLMNAGVEAATLLLEGRAAETILEYAQDQQADLILLSSHGQSGLSGWNVSGVVQKVILRAHTSVMIVRAYQVDETKLGDLHYRKILLPLDGSARAEVAIPIAAALAREVNAVLVAAHVVQRPVVPRRTPLDADEIELSDAIVEKNRAEALRYFDDLTSRLGVDLQTRLIIDDAPTAALHHLAEQEDAQLMILTAHGHSGDTHRPFGSVVLSFITFGATPLLVIQDLSSENIQPTRAEILSREVGGR